MPLGVTIRTFACCVGPLAILSFGCLTFLCILLTLPLSLGFRCLTFVCILLTFPLHCPIYPTSPFGSDIPKLHLVGCHSNHLIIWVADTRWMSDLCRTVLHHPLQPGQQLENSQLQPGLAHMWSHCLVHWSAIGSQLVL